MSDFLDGLKKTFSYLEGDTVEKIYQKGNSQEIEDFEKFLSAEGIIADPEKYKTVQSCIEMLYYSINNIRFIPEEIQDDEIFRDAFYQRLESQISNETLKFNKLALKYDDDMSAKRKIINAIVPYITSPSLKLYVLMEF